jgi:hypothetical protein
MEELLRRLLEDLEVVEPEYGEFTDRRNRRWCRSCMT